MSKNGNLHNAKTQKNDEFYTQYEDIQKELNHYEQHFKGKTVLCNCDDPFESNFCKFFLRNFNYLGLKRLICTSYNSSPFAGTQISLFDLIEGNTEQGHGYVLDVSSVPMKNGRGVSDDDIDKLLRTKKVVRELKGNGDFRSDECMEYLKQADIVVTNPPFSLFREYVATLMEYGKQFLIVGSQNAITYKEFFPLLKDNKVWLGNNPVKKFLQPNGNYKQFGNILWYTNLDISKRHEEIVLYKNYSPEEYPTYDNYDAINVDKVSDIPKDYDGVMGVPITFMDKYNPEQFEIVGLGTTKELYTPTKTYINPKKHFTDGRCVSANEINSTLAYPITKEQVKNVYYTADNVSEYLFQPYARILIRRKQ